jgi:hypothetical protein
MNRLARAIFAVAPEVRYLATHRGGELELHQREGIAGASAAESDKYEELLVNPTVLTILTRRGEIDCGGLGYVVVRYGNFFELLVPVRDGHVSVALEPRSDPSLFDRVLAVIRQETEQER